VSSETPEPSASTPKLYRGLKRALDRPGADRAVVVLALILLCFSLDTGLSADDYVHQLIARGTSCPASCALRSTCTASPMPARARS
jgi:hypothetical protein